METIWTTEPRDSTTEDSFPTHTLTVNYLGQTEKAMHDTNDIDYRELQDGSIGNVTTSAPTPVPTVPPTNKSSSSGSGYLVLFFFVLCIVGTFVGWRLIRHCRRRREQRLLGVRSAQANRVLGDLQMIPNEDLDDNELI